MHWSCLRESPVPASPPWPWHSLCRGAAAVSRIRLAICQTSLPPDDSAESGCDRRLAAGGSVAAATWLADHSILGWQRYDALEPLPDALLTRRRVPAAPDHAVCRVIFTQHSRGRVPEVSWAGLDPVYGRAAGRPDLRRILLSRGAASDQTQDRAQLLGDIHECQALRLSHLCDDTQPADEMARIAIHAKQRVSSRQSCSGSSAEPPCMFWTSQPPACTLPTSTN
jgi:hypothetical protein